MTFRHPLAAAAAVAAAVAVSAQAQAACQSFPKVPWWGKLSHDRVVRYVNRKHGGDWSPYVAKWERQLAKIEDVYQRNSRIVLRKKGIVIEGPALADYIEKMRRRVTVNRCLAREATESAALGASHTKERS